MKGTCRIRDIRIDVQSRRPVAVVEFYDKQEFLSEADELIASDMLDIEIKKHRKKRSLSANAYAWVLMDKLASVLSIPKEKIYKDIVRNIGGNTTSVTVQKEACDRLLEQWSRNGLGWFGEVVYRNEQYCDVMLYYGSSTYDTKQMSRLIELVIQECEAQGIATETLQNAAYLEGLLSQ